jgi:hypothetical protein
MAQQSVDAMTNWEVKQRITVDLGTEHQGQSEHALNRTVPSTSDDKKPPGHPWTRSFCSTQLRLARAASYSKYCTVSFGPGLVSNFK